MSGTHDRGLSPAVQNPDDSKAPALTQKSEETPDEAETTSAISATAAKAVQQERCRFPKPACQVPYLNENMGSWNYRNV